MSQFSRLNVVATYLAVTLFSAFFYVYAYSNTNDVFDNAGLVTAIWVFVGLVTLAAHHTKTLKNHTAFWLLIPILILSFDVIIYANDFVRFAIPLALYVLSLSYTLFLTGSYKHLAFWRISIFTKFMYMLGETVPAFFKSVGLVLIRSKSEKSTLYKKILLGFMISLPLLFIFFGLFMMSDALFANAIDNVEISDELARHMVNFSKGLWFFFCLSLVALAGLGKYNQDHPEKHFAIPTEITATVLVSLNALFAIFNYFQLKYVVFQQFSANYFIEQDLTYADYVHEGFMQMVVAVLLAAGIVLAVKLSSKQLSTLTTALATLISIQTMVIAISALKKMVLYKEAYGYTVLRLHVEWFIYLLLGLLAFFVIGLVFEMTFSHFMAGTSILFLAAFLLVSTVSAEIISTNKNIMRAQNGEELDIYYLLEMSSDVNQSLIDLSHDVERNPQLIENLQDREVFYVQVQDKVKRDRIEMGDNEEASGWRYFRLNQSSWN